MTPCRIDSRRIESILQGKFVNNKLDLFRLFKENKSIRTHDRYNFAASKIKTTDPLQVQVSLVRLGAGREDRQDKRG